MAAVGEQKRIQQEVYAITGQHVPEDDVLVLAALFYAHKMQDAARQAAGHINTAGAASRAVVDDAANAVRQATKNNLVLAEAFDARLQKGLRQVLQFQSRMGGGTALTARHMLAAFAAGAVAVVLAISFASGFSYSWMSDAAMGRAFNRVSPELDPAVRTKVMDQLRKKLSG